ncbi:fibronectin type III-like domain-contianing protein [Streptomyces echinatus]|uniref:fibronectin type III-like domain-contianing protein n=1 Tax=Streptomyces echinatus TaxID=67293 RepID=UPI003CD055A6
MAAGESVTARIELDRRDFAFWDEHRDRWTIESGAFTIEIGSSSRDIRAPASASTWPATPPPRRSSTGTRRCGTSWATPNSPPSSSSSCPLTRCSEATFDSLPPLARRIVTETINGMPLEKLRLVSEVPSPRTPSPRDRPAHLPPMTAPAPLPDAATPAGSTVAVR